MTQHQPPRLAPERIDQMAAFATSFAQEAPRPSFWQRLTAHKAGFTLGALGSAAVAASIIFVIATEPPTQTKVRNTPNEVSDIMLYNLLEDLS